MISIESLCLGMVQTNVYFLKNTDSGEILITDPADNAPRIFRKVDEMGGTPVAVLLTHGHFDHIFAAREVADKYSIPIVAAAAEEKLLADPLLNMSGMTGRTPVSLKADIQVNDLDEPEIGGFKFRVLLTPGHTAGSCCYYFYDDKLLISGDTLFYCSCGRTDFATSSSRDMMESLKRLISTLPEDTRVYPGHDCATDIGFEKRNNPFV